MKKIYLFFPKKYTYRKLSINKFIGWCIKRKTKGDYFHVGVFADGVRIEDNCAPVYEAQAPAKKVVLVPINRYNNNILVDVYGIEVPDIAHKKIFDYLRKMVGSRYDFRGVLSFIFGFIKQRNSQFYCSELVNKAFRYAGITLSPNDRVSPSELVNDNRMILIKKDLPVMRL